MLTKGIKISGYKGEVLRLAIHNDIKRDDIDYLIKNIHEYISKHSHE